MSRYGKQILVLCFVLALVAGCGRGTSRAEEQEDSTKSEQAERQSESERQSKVKAPNMVEEEIPFQQITWYGMEPDREREAGIWLYTKRQHPGSMADVDFDWDQRDMLLVQLGNQDLFGYNMSIRKIEVVDSETVRVVVRLQPSFRVGGPMAEAARAFVSVRRGDLDGKKFLVVSEDGKELQY